MSQFRWKRWRDVRNREVSARSRQRCTDNLYTVVGIVDKRKDFRDVCEIGDDRQKVLLLMEEGECGCIIAIKDVHDQFNEQVDAGNRLMAWGWSDVNSWYKNERGRVAQNWPFTLLEYWQRTADPQKDEYELFG